MSNVVDSQSPNALAADSDSDSVEFVSKVVLL